MLKLFYVVTSLPRSLQSQMHFPQDPIESKFCPATSNEDSPLKTVHIPRPLLPQQQPLLLSYWMAKQFSYVQTRQQIPQSIQSQLLYQVCQNKGIVKRVISVTRRHVLCDVKTPIKQRTPWSLGSLRSTRFRAVQVQRTRNGRVPRSLFAPKPNGNACQAGQSLGIG